MTTPEPETTPTPAPEPEVTAEEEPLTEYTLSTTVSSRTISGLTASDFLFKPQEGQHSSLLTT